MSSRQRMEGGKGEVLSGGGVEVREEEGWRVVGGGVVDSWDRRLKFAGTRPPVQRRQAALTAAAQHTGAHK